jgi:hypothetical protein
MQILEDRINKVRLSELIHTILISLFNLYSQIIIDLAFIFNIKLAARSDITLSIAGGSGSSRMPSSKYTRKMVLPQ